ncbi:protein winged eye-like [Onthophagus taurus]|uniref:protein winged eye-like n=1 Tax=Onthophagus taurus TaxID=166361 RepID=UPI0039BE3686
MIKCYRQDDDDDEIEDKFNEDKFKENKLIENKFNENKLNENKFNEDKVKDKLKQEKLKLGQDKLSQENVGANLQKNVKNEMKEIDCRCLLKPDDLDKKRVLTAMGGLFYAGEFKAIEPLDILEVYPRNEKELTVGTRVVAYRSQKYRCLYPGSVAEPDSSTSKFLSVYFDDGDNGKIPLKDIRLLPSDYPFMKYDPNSLSSLSKSKRRTLTTEDSRGKNSTPPTPNQKFRIISKSRSHQTDSSTFNNINGDKEKKKMENPEIEKKERKHRCTEENCQHKNRKHKKHKKHLHKDEKSHEKNTEVLKITNEEIDFDSKKSFKKIDSKEINEEKDINDVNDFNVELEDEITMENIEDTLDESSRVYYLNRITKMRTMSEQFEGNATFCN